MKNDGDRRRQSVKEDEPECDECPANDRVCVYRTEPLAELQRTALSHILTSVRPAQRPNGSWASTITSVDVKLTYNQTRDEFIPFITSDINASPEGLLTVHGKQCPEVDMAPIIADAYLANLLPKSKLSLLVSLSPQVYSAQEGKWIRQDSWLTRDRQHVVEAIEEHPRVAEVHLTTGGTGFHEEDDRLYVEAPTSEEVDGYVNLDDVGTQLRRDGAQQLDTNQVQFFARGSNAPSGVWDPELPVTGKAGLLRAAEVVQTVIPKVKVPTHQIVRSLPEIREYLQEQETPVVFKGPFGTHGDETVVIPEAEEVRTNLYTQERKIREKRDWPEYSLYDENSIRINSRGGRSKEIQYATVERAIAGEFQQDGEEYTTVEVPASGHPNGMTTPIDFIPLTMTTDRESIQVPSVVVRISGLADLNANKSSAISELYSLKKLYEGEVTIPNAYRKGDFQLDFREVLSNVAGRPVGYTEVREAVGQAGILAFGVRNLCAFQAERQLLGESAPSPSDELEEQLAPLNYL